MARDRATSKARAKSRSKSNTTPVKRSPAYLKREAENARPIPPKKPIPLEGRRFVRLPGKRYYDTQTGQEYSRRQYQKINPDIRDETLSREALTSRRITQARYNSLLNDYVRHIQKTDPSVTAGQLRKSDRFKHLQSELRAKNKDGSPAQSRIKSALSELGRREGLSRNDKLGAYQKNYTRNKETGIWERNR